LCEKTTTAPAELTTEGARSGGIAKRPDDINGELTMNVSNSYTICGLGFCPKNYPVSEHATMKTHLIQSVLIPNPIDKRSMKVTCN
jgi:hypothetical protein